MNALFSALLRVVLFFVGLLATLMPRRLEIGLGPVLGRLYMALDRRRREIARDNIRRCLPELSPARREELLVRNFEHYGILGLELMHLFSPVPGHYRAYVARTSELEGLENWRRAKDKGKGILFIATHFANWEITIGAGGLRGIAPSIVTRRLRPGWLHDKVAAERATVGVNSLAGSHSLPQVLRILRKGGGVVFVMDQYAHPPSGMPVRFFGALVNTLAAVGSLALRTGAAVVPVIQRRDAAGVMRVAIGPEIDLGDAAKDPGRATAMLAARVEDWIRANPSQWLWAHRRFKNAVWPVAAAQEAR